MQKHRVDSTSRARALSQLGAFVVSGGRIRHSTHARPVALSDVCAQDSQQHSADTAAEQQECSADSTSRARALSQPYISGSQAAEPRQSSTSRARALSFAGVLFAAGRYVSSTSRARALSLLSALLTVMVAFTLIAPAAQVNAATSDELNFQGRLLTNTGGLVPDGTYNMEFNLYYVSSGGSAVWTEDRLNTNTEGVTVRNGYFSVYLGEYDAFGAIDWSEDLYLGLTVRGTGSAAWGSLSPADGEMSPRFKLTSVPYAFRAANVASSDTDSADSDDVSITTGDTTTSGNSGDIIIDNGVGATANGSIQIGSTNASSVLIGRAGTTTTIQGSVALTGAGTALTVTNDAQFNGGVTIGSDTSDSLTVEADATFNGALTVSTGDVFQNAGATLFSATSISDRATGGNIGTAATTVDVATTFDVNQTTAGQTLTLPMPTNTASGRVVYVNNVGSENFTMYGETIETGSSSTFIWNGSSWTTSVSFSNTGVDTVGALDGVAAAANGATISGTTIYLQSASATAAGLVNTASQTFAGTKTFNNGIVLAANQTLTVTGGTTANRPGSPTAGMVYYDTNTNTLLTYNGAKWIADRGEYIIVAANDSTQAEKDSADYVADNTDDHLTINSAIGALSSSGGKVLLLPGTFTVDGSIEITSNVTLAGSGQEATTLIAQAGALAAQYDVIENANPGSTDNNITIRDLTIDGNKDNVTGNDVEGILLDTVGSGSGATYVRGFLIENVTVTDTEGNGIDIDTSANGLINNVLVKNNGSASYGIRLTGSDYIRLENNDILNGGGSGVLAQNSDYLVITGNLIDNQNSEGLNLNAAVQQSVIDGNRITNNGSRGIQLDGPGAKQYNVISNNYIGNNTSYGLQAVNTYHNSVVGNLFYTNDSSGSGSHIDLGGSGANNSLVGNTIRESSSDGSISIEIGASQTNTYLADNLIDNVGAVSDSSTSTIYANQIDASDNLVLQASGTADVLINSDTNITGTLTVSGLATFNGGLTIEAGDTFTFNTDAFTDFTGGGLYNNSGLLSVTNTGASGFFQNGGNLFGTTATLGTNDLNPLVLRTNSTTALTIDTSQNITTAGNLDVAGRGAFGNNGSIGTTSVSQGVYAIDAELSVEANITAATDLQYTAATANILSINPASNPANQGFISGSYNGAVIDVSNTTDVGNLTLSGVLGEATAQGSGDIGTVEGGSFGAVNSSTGTVTTLRGSISAALNYGGSVTNMNGAQLTSANVSTSTVSSARGANILIGNLAGGTITEAKGVNVRYDNASGTITNAAGVVVESVAGTNTTNLLLGTGTIPSGNYSIYNASTAANYFAGNLTLNQALLVNGNTTIGNANTDTLTINAGSSGSGITFGDSSFANCTLTTVAGVLTCGSSGSASDLQGAYVGGNTIVATNAEGDIDLTVSEATNFTVDITGTGSFQVQDSGTVALSVDETSITLAQPTINIGSTVATAINIGNNSSTTTIDGGNVYTSGNTAVLSGNSFTVQSGSTLLTGPGTAANTLTINNHTGTGNILEVQDAATAVFTIADGGAVVLQNTTDSTAGFQILDADGGTAIFTVDTTNERVGIGTSAPVAGFEVATDISVASNRALKWNAYYNGANDVYLADGSAVQQWQDESADFYRFYAAAAGAAGDPISFQEAFAIDLNSATLGDVTFDSGTLYVDASANAVSIGNTGTLQVAGLTTLNGGLTVEAGDTFTFNSDAFSDFTGGGLYNNAGVLSVTNTGANGFFQNGGNSFGVATTIGTNDAQALGIETGGTTRFTVASAASTLTGNGATSLIGGSTLTLNAAAASALNLGTTQTSGVITIGGTGAATGAINLGTGTGAQAINLGTGGTGAKTVTIGSTASTSSATLRSGSGGIALQAGTGAVSISGTVPNSAQGSLTTISGTSTGTADQVSGLLVGTTFNPSGSSDIDVAGIISSPINSNGNLNGGDATLIGVSGIPQFTGAGSIDGLIGFAGTTINSGGGTVGVAMGAQFLNAVNSGTITRNIGINIDNQTSGANNTNLFIGGTTAPLGNYSIYNSSAYDNYFAGALEVDGLVELDGGLTVEAGDTFTFNSDAFTDFTGGGLVNTGGVLSVDATSASGFFQNGGNSFSGTATLGTNDANSLVFEVGGVDALTIADGGAITVQNETDSTTGFQVLDADGGDPVFNIDTTNERVGIGTASPNALLEIAGAGLTDQLRLAYNGTWYTALYTDGAGDFLIAPSGNNTSITGTLSVSSNADVADLAVDGGDLTTTAGTFNLLNTNASTVNAFGAATAINLGAATGTTTVSNNLTVNGSGLFQNASDSTSAFQVVTASTGTNRTLLNVDTTNELITVKGTVFDAATVQAFTGSGNITQSNIDGFGTILISSDAAGYTATLQDPTSATAGRLVYVTNTGSFDMTLAANSGGTLQEVTLKPNTSATMVWNGSDWTAAGASSSTDLQAAYNNTATSAGGAELILNAPGGAADGLTVRNNATTPITGGLLEIQTSIGSNLFSVNNNATEFASNGGAETAGASAAAFPGSTWSAPPTGGTVSRFTTTGDNVATGQASVQVVTAGTDDGAANQLASALTPNLEYTVSFTARGLTNFTSLEVVYSRDGTNGSTTACATGETVTSGQWTRITCTFAAPSSGITSANEIFIRQTDGTARTFYIDNLSVNINASATYAADGSVDDSGSFATNWTNFDGGAGSSVVTEETSVIYDTSASAEVATSANANQGIRNNLAIDPATDTQYLVSFYARTDTTMSGSLAVGFLPTGGTSTPSGSAACTDYNTQSLTAGVWAKITCLFTTTGTTITNPDLVIYQTDSTARSLFIDALSITLNTNNSNNVQVGGGNLGGPVTLFTLDRSAGNPIADNNEAYLGSMYYDTITGRIQCYEADGWGACGAAPDNVVNLNPEYAGSVLNGSGVGTMTADFCSNGTDLTVNTSFCDSGEARNYYNWTSPQATEQTYSIYVTYQLPETFNGFSSDDTVQLVGRVDNTSNASVTYEMFHSTGADVTQCGTGETDVITGGGGSADTWYSYGINGNESTGCSLNASAAGDFIIFKINLKAQSNANAYVSTLSFVTTGR